MRGRPNRYQAHDGAGESGDWSPGTDVQHLDALGRRREEGIREYRRLLDGLRERAERSDEDAAVYLGAIGDVSVEELTHYDLMKLARDLDAPITPADSLFMNIALRRRMKQLGPVPENHLGVSKDADRTFASVFDLRVPELLYSGPLAEVPQQVRRGTVLKPERSSDSRGVFYLFGKDRIRSVQHAQTLADWSSMLDAIEQELGRDDVDHERWQVQELIVEDADSTPARDLKFYTFYGEIGLILEASRHESRQYQYFNPDGTLADCGRDFEPRFTDASATITDKGGVPERYLAEVRELSRQIPVPYMRIDYLNGIGGLVFNEMSSAPGLSHFWSDEYDRRMGTMYHEAQIRLMSDLLDGKQFAGYQRFRRMHREIRRSTDASAPHPHPAADSERYADRGRSPRRGRPSSPISFGAEDSRHWDLILESRGLDALLEDREWSLDRHRMLLEHLRRRAAQSDRDAQQYLDAVDAASIDELTHLDLVTIGRTLGVDLTTADSFFRSIVLRRRKKQLGRVPERLLGLSRATDQLFAAALGVRVPAILHTGSLVGIPDGARVGTLLKLLGAPGQTNEFHLIEQDHIRRVHDGHIFTSWSELIACIEGEHGPSSPHDGTWQVQELFDGVRDGSAREIRLYTFYGEIGLVQVFAGQGDRGSHFFDVEGAVAGCGREQDIRPIAAPTAMIPDVTDFGSRFEQFGELSREIPAPFMCIDCLEDAGSLVFLGMSSAPGGAHTFNDEWDRRLGKMYSEAEVRLTNDLLAGKPFDGYRRFLEKQAAATAP